MLKNKLLFKQNRFKTKSLFVACLVLAITVALCGTVFAEVQNAQPKYPVPGWETSPNLPSPWFGNGNSIMHYNASNQAYNPYSPSVNTAHVLWTYSMYPGGVYSAGAADTSPGGLGAGAGKTDGKTIGFFMQAPMVGAGEVVFETGTPFTKEGFNPAGVITALDEYTGQPIWKTTSPNQTQLGGNSATFRSQQSQPADTVFAPAILFMPSHAPCYTVVDATSGIIQGTFDCGTGYGSFTNLYYNGTVYQVVNKLLSAYYIGGEPSTYSSTPKLLWGNVSCNGVTATDGNVLVCQGTGNAAIIGIDIKTGTQLWNASIVSSSAGSVGDGLFILPDLSGVVHALDLNTGQEKWTYSLSDASYWGYGGCMAYGNFYQGNYNGKMYCWDDTTGDLEWSFDVTSYMENLGYTIPEQYLTAYGGWPIHMNPIAAGGLVYVITGDHSPPNPNVPGSQLFAFNATTGDIVWSYGPICGIITYNPAIADGLLFMPDYYTGYMYCFGQGNTAVTVSTSQSEINNGEYTWINGQVTDQSPGQTGTPAVSEASMSAWMSYLHAGGMEPTDVTGVPVTLSAVSVTTGAVTQIDTVTTDSQGDFSYKWTPPDEDQYRITADFAGSASYFSSSNTTLLAVGPQSSVDTSPTSTSAPTVTSEPVTQEAAFTTADGVLIVAVAVAIIIGIVNLVAIRKQRK
jgi:outer membrane protein assembly factor BamB